MAVGVDRIVLLSVMIFFTTLILLSFLGVGFFLPAEGKLTSECMGISNMASRNRCYFDKALAGEPLFCDKIAEYALKKSCVFNLSKRTPKACLLLAGYDRDLCHHGIIHCNNVVDGYLKDSCRNLTAECGKISNEHLRDLCWARIASKDPKLCDNIGDDYSRTRCVMASAVKGGNQGICDLLGDWEASVCQKAVSGVPGCQTIQDPWWRAECETLASK